MKRSLETENVIMLYREERCNGTAPYLYSGGLRYDAWPNTGYVYWLLRGSFSPEVKMETVCQATAASIRLRGISRRCQ
jgi:hypothetical protein